MEELLFQSEGNPPKRKRAMHTCAGVLIVCGLILVAISSAEGGSFEPFLWLGVGAIGVGILCCFLSGSNSGNQAKLYIYEQHVEGAQISPYKPFSLRYDEINDVQKVKMFSNEMILLQSGKECFTVLTDDVEKAYSLICDKVYGEA